VTSPFPAGRVLTFKDNALRLLPYVDDGPDSKSQKWKLDSAGAHLHKATKKALVMDLGSGTGPYKPRLYRRGGQGCRFDVLRFCEAESREAESRLYDDDDDSSSDSDY
jgi:hypothetical protein